MNPIAWTFVGLLVLFPLGYFFGQAAGYAKGYEDATRRRSLGGRIWRS